MSRTARGWLLLLMLTAAFLLYCRLVDRIDNDDTRFQQQQYCDMVRAYKQDHSVGWPDYKHTYRKDCISHDDR